MKSPNNSDSGPFRTEARNAPPRSASLCPRAEEAAAWATGALDAEARASFAAHRRQCAACAQEADGFRALVDRLRRQPQAEPSPDLTARVMAALPPNAFDTGRVRGRRRRFIRPAFLWPAAAAALLLCGLGLWQVGAFPGGEQPASAAGCAWIARHQEPDGSWDPVKLGGSTVYRPALTALATLALARDPERYGRQIANACAALVRSQMADGGVGPEDSGRMYNHALATYALLTVHARGGHDELQDAIRRALAFTCNRQQVEGGWGYRPSADESANTAVTAWQVQVLASARDQGWADAGGNLRKGLAWLQRRADGQGRFGYTAGGAASTGSSTLDAMAAYTLLRAGGGLPELRHTATAAINHLRADSGARGGTTDFYRAFFTAAAWEAAGDGPRARAVRADVCGRRETRGAERGSWAPSDVWGAVGGRLCATSLAVLTLQPRSEHL